MMSRETRPWRRGDLLEVTLQVRSVAEDPLRASSTLLAPQFLPPPVCAEQDQSWCDGLLMC